MPRRINTIKRAEAYVPETSSAIARVVAFCALRTVVYAAVTAAKASSNGPPAYCSAAAGYPARTAPVIRVSLACR